MKWARHKFEVSKPDKNGVSLKQHLEQVERQTGITPDELKEPVAFPQVIGYIWSAFCVLSNHRSSGFNSPDPITFEQIVYWKQLTETETKPWEIDIILSLDQIYREILNG